MLQGRRESGVSPASPGVQGVSGTQQGGCVPSQGAGDKPKHRDLPRALVFAGKHSGHAASAAMEVDREGRGGSRGAGRLSQSWQAGLGPPGCAHPSLIQLWLSYPRGKGSRESTEPPTHPCPHVTRSTGPHPGWGAPWTQRPISVPILEAPSWLSPAEEAHRGTRLSLVHGLTGEVTSSRLKCQVS